MKKERTKLSNIFQISRNPVPEEILSKEQDVCNHPYYGILKDKDGMRSLESIEVNFGATGDVDLRRVKPVKKGDFFIERGLMSLDKGAFFMIKEDGFIEKTATAITPIKPEETCSDFYSFMFRTEEFLRSLEQADHLAARRQSSPMTVVAMSKRKVSLDGIGDTKIPDLSYPEQVCVAAEYAEKIMRTRILILRQEEQLRLMKELDRSLTHEASGYATKNPKFIAVLDKAAALDIPTLEELGYNKAQVNLITNALEETTVKEVKVERGVTNRPKP